MLFMGVHRPHDKGKRANSMHRGNKHTGQGWLANSFVVFHSLWPLSSVGFGNTQFKLPYVAEVFTRYSMDFLG